MNKFMGLIMVALLCSCKATKPLVSKEVSVSATETASSRIIQKHYANNWNFSTVYLKSSVKYKDAKNTQNVNAEIRIQKDEAILISVRLLGITMAKALITPSQVKYYEKLNGEYFEGDYAALSRWLGTDLDFAKVQRLLIGQAMNDLRILTYESSTEGGFNTLMHDGSTITKFYFDPENFLLRKQMLAQPAQQRSLEIQYPDYQQYPESVLPIGLLIEALQPSGKTTIEVRYDSATFNEAMTFPYSVPSGYQKIDIND